MLCVRGLVPFQGEWGSETGKYQFIFTPPTQHLGGGAPPEGYEEMACDSCMASHEFLEPYKMAVPVKVKESEQTGEQEGEEGRWT